MGTRCRCLTVKSWLAIIEYLRISAPVIKRVENGHGYRVAGLKGKKSRSVHKAAGSQTNED